MRAISGKEGKVKEYIEAMLHQGGEFAKHVNQVLIPTEKVVTIANGKRKVKEKNRFAGYVFVEAELVGEVQPMLRNVPNVLGFLRLCFLFCRSPGFGFQELKAAPGAEQRPIR